MVVLALALGYFAFDKFDDAQSAFETALRLQAEPQPLTSPIAASGRGCVKTI